jgi:Protein-tyrosine-phosphatase-like, N-terminal domain
MSTDIEEPVALGVVRTLSSEFDSFFTVEAIEKFVNESLSEFENARVRDFVPLFVYRIARERLLNTKAAG